MKHMSKITITGALLFSLTSTAYGQSSSMSTPTPDSTGITTSTSPNGNAQSTTPYSDGSATTSSTSTMQQTATSTLTKAQSTVQGKDGAIIVTPDNVQWKDAPMLPPGAQYAILEGNPKAKGSVTVRIKLPANYQVPSAYLQTPQHITVLSGTLNLGMGDKVDTSAGTALPTGSFAVVPARKHHYVYTSDETLVQVSGMGPWQVKYVNPKDDPRKNKAAAPAASQIVQPAPTSGSSNMGVSGTGNSSSNPSTPSSTSY